MPTRVWAAALKEHARGGERDALRTQVGERESTDIMKKWGDNLPQVAVVYLLFFKCVGDMPHLLSLAEANQRCGTERATEETNLEDTRRRRFM